MPAIAVSRGPLQQIIERVEPASARVDARLWEEALGSHRQLLQAAVESRASLRAHYEHEMVVRPGERESLERELAAELKRLDGRFADDGRERVAALRVLEGRVLAHLGSQGPARGVGAAAAQLLAAEIHWARAADLGLPLDPVLKALARVENLAPDRLTRERAAQIASIIHTQAGRRQAAEEILERVLRKGASWTMEPELWNRYGDLLLQGGRFALAARAYGKVQPKRAAWFARSRLGLAWCRHRLGDDDAALRAVEAVAKALDGLWGSAADAARSEAQTLRAQLLAEASGRIPETEAPAWRETIRGLREARVTVVPHPEHSPVAGDGRLKQVALRAPALRACYRALLGRAPAAGGRTLVVLDPVQPPRVLPAGLGDATFSECVRAALSEVPRLPDDVPAVVSLLWRDVPAS